MSDWRLSANSSIYTDALKATETLGTPAVGFVKPTEVTERITSVQLKQNNTVLQILIKIKEDLEDLKVAVRRIEAAKAKEAQPEELSTSIDELQKQLSKLSLGAGPSQPRVTKPKGKLFVFKNPQDIFNTEKNRLK